MANQKKPYRWRAYLDDFQTDATGRYVYTGKRYAFDGDARSRVVYLTKIVFFCFLVAVSTILPECLPPTAISRTPVTLIPWALQLISTLVLSWSVARLFAHAAELRAYVWRATVRTLPGKSLAAAILSAATLICHVAYLLVRRIPFDGFTAVRTVSPAVALVSALLLFFTARAGKWREIA